MPSTKHQYVVVIRADESTQIGSGHVMRCIALGIALLKHKCTVYFIGNIQNSGLVLKIKKSGIHFIHQEEIYPHTQDINDFNHLAESLNIDWIVLDGYHFDSSYQKSLMQGQSQLCVIDDNHHLEQYFCNMILNQNSHASTITYKCHKNVQQLLGNSYVLLRPEFLEYQKKTLSVNNQLNILITLGGSDPSNATQTILEVLNTIPQSNFTATIVCGPGYTFLSQLETFCTSISFPYTIKVNTQNMPELIDTADVAITAAGSTVWELGFMKKPMLLIVTAENQLRVAHSLTHYNIQHINMLNSPKKDLILSAVEDFLYHHPEHTNPFHIDGKGSYRVAQAMVDLCSPLPSKLPLP
ncbi:MAG: UDP-2,4-diacetamido-2,4,6-trideoxy-beta-L-altropyranose hydrolase [Fibrobacterales bacterium]